MQEEMNRRELGMKPLFLALWLVFFMTNGKSPGRRSPTAPAAEKYRSEKASDGEEGRENEMIFGKGLLCLTLTTTVSLSFSLSLFLSLSFLLVFLNCSV